MINIRDPRHRELFDSFQGVLTPAARKRLDEGWAGLLRHVILALLPAWELANRFSPTTGAPTKELFSMAGLVWMMEFMDWTKEEAVSNYIFNMEVHYALNLEPVAQDLSVRTLERYIKIFIEEELAAGVMRDVTDELVRLLDLDIREQRLDSTHVFSDMAMFGRTRLMGVVVKRFLTQVKRHDRAAYDALDEGLRSRYAPSIHRLFGDTAKGAEPRRRLRQEVAEDLYALVVRFADEKGHANRQTYKDMERVLHEQCQVEEAAVTIRAHPGGDIMQNPSDPDATRDGHKGPGFQVQLTETCGADNEAQLVTSAVPQTAVEADSSALQAVLDDLKEAGLTPETLLADAGYGSDANAELCEAEGVELVSPTLEGARAIQQDAACGGGKDNNIKGESAPEPPAAPHPLNIDDFVIDEVTELVERCPAGHTPESSLHNSATGTTTTTMPSDACSACPFQTECPIKVVNGTHRLTHTAKARRLASRRREEQTRAFRERYRIRSGIEGTNSGLKRRTGLGRLRVRGQPRVFHSILLKVAGWNLLRAASCPTLRRIVSERVSAARFLVLLALRPPRAARGLSRPTRSARFPAPLAQLFPISPIPTAA